VSYLAPFVGVHLGCLLLFVTGVSADMVAVFLVTFPLRAFGITAGYHRYFSHRSFETSRGFRFVLAVLGSLALQKGVLWWAAMHRRHHRHADRPGDPHSPVQDGFWFAHMGWFLADDAPVLDAASVPDLARHPELVWLERWFIVPPLLLAMALFAVGGLPWLVAGFFCATTFVWHGTYLVNSLGHRIGRRRFETRDDSRNSVFLALLAWGEGWHNNHHRYPASARQGFRWWEVDLTYYCLCGLRRLGVVWDVVEPPAELRGGRVARRQPRCRGDFTDSELEPARHGG